MTNVQAFIYFQTHRCAGMTFYKLAVIWFWSLDALHLALITHCLYHYFVINFGNFSALEHIEWCFKVQIVVDVCIVFGVLGLYAHRIWIVSNGRSRVLSAVVGMILIAGLGVGVALVWVVYQCHTFTDLLRFEWAAYMTLSAIAFIDFVIASSLCYLLAKSRTGFSGTDSFLTTLMTYIINTGAMTSITSIIAMITCAAMPRNFVFISIEFVIAQLYVNSYLALLNARYYFRPGDSDSLGSSAFRAHPSSPHSGEFTAEKHQVKHSYDHGDELYLIRPVRAVTPQRPIAVTVEVNSFSSV